MRIKRRRCAAPGAPAPSHRGNTGGPHSAKVPTLQAIPYTSDTAEFNAVLSHSIDLDYMPLTDVPQLNAVKAAGYHVFGYPDFGFSYVNYNFADKTGDFNNIINQLYIRQALGSRAVIWSAAGAGADQGTVLVFRGGLAALPVGGGRRGVRGRLPGQCPGHMLDDGT